MRRVRGQAAVETAITMPLLLFMILGTLQLFMVLQARILAQYAASRAVRAGAQNFGDCNTMYDTAHLVLLPAIDASFARGAAVGQRYADAVRERMGRNRYQPGPDDRRNGPVVWMDRLEPQLGALLAANEEEVWDLPPHKDLVVRMVFWAPLKIPFANWVFARIALAQWGLKPLTTADPLMPVKRNAGWEQVGGGRSDEVALELRDRYEDQQYVFPIQVTYATRMMSPARFRQQDCPR